jgi:stress-induced morphogen
MEKSLMKKLPEVLKKKFPKATLELEKSGPGKVAGFLIWPDFAGMEQIKRQEALWKVLKRELNPDELSQITAILTMTPEEMPVPQKSRPRHAV